MLHKSWTVNGSTPADGATALDARLAQAGLYSRSAAGVVRAGVLGARVGIVSSRSDMALDIDAFEAVLSRSKTYGVTPIANDGIVGVNLPAAPSSNSRWVRVYVIQRDNTDAADSTNAVEFGVVAGAAAAAPTLPALPTGALPIARVLQPANVLGTADCTVTEDFPMTAPLGGLVPVRDATERGNWAPDVGSSAWQMDKGIQLLRTSAGWVPALPKTIRFAQAADVNGFVTITHNLGFVPLAAQITVVPNATDGINKILSFMEWELTANTVRVRAIRNDSHEYFSNPLSGAVTLHFT